MGRGEPRDGITCTQIEDGAVKSACARSTTFLFGLFSRLPDGTIPRQKTTKLVSAWNVYD